MRGDLARTDPPTNPNWPRLRTQTRIAFISLLVAALPLLGCKSVPCEAIPALQESFAVLAAEYREYIAADGALTDEQRVRRLEHLEEHAGLLEDLAVRCGKEAE